MLRKSALALLLLASCGAPDEENDAAVLVLTGSARPAPLATVTLASAGGDTCTARWNGEAVTGERLLERSIQAVEGAIAAVGGIQNITEGTMPMVHVTAPAGLRFACLRAMLDSIERAGIPRVGLIVGNAREPAFADFPLSDSGTDTASYIINIDAAGRLTWNGQATDLAGVRAQTRAAAGRPGVAAAPGQLALVPDDAATAGSVYEVVRAAGEAGLSPMLARDSAPPPE
jgi:biopolymer transport protein ExbD